MTTTRRAPTVTTRRDQAGTWNLRKGRAWSRVPALLRKERLSWLAVQELTGKGPRLQRRLDRLHRRGKLPHGYTVVAATDGDSAVIVRDDVPYGAVQHHRMGGIRWERKPGRPGLHPDRIAVSLRIGPHRGGYRVLPVHLPPKGGRNMPLREAARIRYRTRYAAIVGRWNTRPNLSGTIGAGDWNDPTTDPEVRALAEALGGTITGNGVDWTLTTGTVDVVRFRRLNKWRLASDHRPRVFPIAATHTLG